MTTTVVGRIDELWRFPVKSMQGEALERVEVGPQGIAGDRAFAVVDRESGRALSGKTVPELLLARAATTAAGTVEVALPDGVALPAVPGPDVDSALSAWLDRDVCLSRATPDTRSTYQMAFEPLEEDAPLFEIPSPGGTYLDWAAVHLLTTGSLATCAAAAPEVAWDRRRFRPTVLVDTPPGDPFPEDAWLGTHLRLGGATTVSVELLTVRCAVPLRAQPSRDAEPALPRDEQVFRTIAELHGKNLGVYASVVQPGAVAVGDEVLAAGG